MDLLFSIIMPVYNVAVYLERSVSSVLSQSGDDYEVILADDGSTDASGALCDAWAKRNKKIRVIHKQNGGLASARNAGLDAAKGSYVLFIDSDDYVEPNMLEVLRKAVQASQNADIIRYDLIMHRATGATPYQNQYARGLYEWENIRNKLVLPILRDTASYLLSSCLHAYRLDFLNKNDLRFVSERLILSEDFLFVLCAMYSAQSLYITDALLYHYEMREGSLTHSPKPHIFEQYTRLHQELIAFFEGKNAPSCYIRLLNKYYVYDLFYLNIPDLQYRNYDGHTWADGRKNVQQMLKSKELRASARDMDISSLPVKEKIKALFIKYGFEPGLALAYRKRKEMYLP